MTGPFKIESNVPVPPRDGRTGRGQKLKYPWGDMKVGDSILFTGDDADTAPSSAHQFGRKRSWTFTTHKNGEGVRVWRIK